MMEANPVSVTMWFFTILAKTQTIKMCNYVSP